MAKFVIAGKANCPYFAKVELLADKLATSVDSFRVHKIVKTPDEWEEWIQSECSRRKFSHSHRSPLIWRELVDRGGKGILIGGANEFQEFANEYYGIKSPLVTSDITKIAEENLSTKHEIDKELLAYRSQSKPMKVCVTNAASPTTYHLITAIASGQVFGEATELTINFLGQRDELESLEGLKMEAIDLAYGQLRGVNVMDDEREALADCQAVIVLDQLTRGEEETEERWLQRNRQMFTERIKVIDDVCRQDVKVLLASDGPVNTALYLMLEEVNKIDKRNVIVAPRLVENQAKALLARKVKVTTSDVVDVIVWGDGESYFCDVSHARVHNHDGPIWGPPFYSRLASLLVHEEQWLNKDFHEQLQLRSGVEREKMNRAPASSRAASVTSLLQQWWSGSPEGQIFTLGVASQGWYGVPEGMVFNFPARFLPDGSWCVIDDLDLSEEVKSRIQLCVEYLMEQRYVLFPDLRPSPPEPSPVEPEKLEEPLSDSPHPPSMTPIREETDQELKPTGESSTDLTEATSESEPVRAASGDQMLEQIKEVSPTAEQVAEQDASEPAAPQEETTTAEEQTTPAEGGNPGAD